MPEPQITRAIVNGVEFVTRAEFDLARGRLKLLAAAALSVLDTERVRTGVDEWDESDQRCHLYNAAEAIIQRDANAEYSGAENAERLIDSCLDQAQ